MGGVAVDDDLDATHQRVRRGRRDGDERRLRRWAAGNDDALAGVATSGGKRENNAESAPSSLFIESIRDRAHRRRVGLAKMLNEAGDELVTRHFTRPRAISDSREA